MEGNHGNGSETIFVGNENEDGGDEDENFLKAIDPVHFLFPIILFIYLIS